jgi:hypothetical protein
VPGRRSRRLGAPLIALALTLVASPSRADEPPPAFTIGSTPAWYLLGGLTTGATLVAHDRGGYVGGELSLARLQEGYFIGAYGDLYRDLGAHRTYATSGLEFGHRFVGFDLGAAARIGGDQVEWGPTGRAFVTVGFFSLYGRYAHFSGSQGAGNDHVVQVGVTLNRVPAKPRPTAETCT